MPAKKKVTHRSNSTSHTRRAPHALSHQHPDHPFFRGLLYFILFLLFFLALLLLFAPTITDFDRSPSIADSRTAVQTEDRTTTFVKLNNGVCNWQDDSFMACGNVNWHGAQGDYVQCAFGGNTEDRRWTESPFTCCGKVGDQEGTKQLRTFLYDDEGNLQDDDSFSVSCTGKPRTNTVRTVRPASTKESYETSFWFPASIQRRPSFAEGSEFVEFPGKVHSCEISGSWITRSSADRVCDGAEGVFFGMADLYQQVVFSDPGLYRWAGPSKALTDPPVTEHQGYGVFMYLCDSNYLVQPRYNLAGSFSGFGTKTLRFDWEYDSNYPRPDVDVFVDLTCEIDK